MTRIAVAGIEQETNSFSRIAIGFEDFDNRSSHGKLLVGSEVFSLRTQNYPVAGFINAADGFGWQVVPLINAYAQTGGRVTDDAFERIMAIMLDQLQKALPVDGVFVYLHGAIATDTHDDAEAEILRQVRTVVGDNMPIVGCSDLHANLTEAYARSMDGLTSFRQFPHIDAAETGARAARLMAQRLSSGPLVSAYSQLNFLIPAHMQGTLDGPIREIYHEVALQEVIRPGVFALSFNCGFNATDVAFAGPNLQADGNDQAACDDAVQHMAHFIEARRAELCGPRLLTPKDAVAEATGLVADGRSALLADVQDNPGAGSGGDCTDIVKALMDAGSPPSAIALLFDPQTAKQAVEARDGAEITCALGGKFTARAIPLTATFSVERSRIEPFKMVGPMKAGMTIDMGPSAVLRHGDIRIIVCSKRIQCVDRGVFLSIGIDPAATPLLVVKSTLHYRNDFDRLGSVRINVAGSGDFKIDPRQNRYRKLRKEMALWPVP